MTLNLDTIRKKEKKKKICLTFSFSRIPCATKFSKAAFVESLAISGDCSQVGTKLRPKCKNVAVNGLTDSSKCLIPSGRTEASFPMYSLPDILQSRLRTPKQRTE